MANQIQVTQYLPTEAEISDLFRTIFGGAIGYDPRGTAINKFVRDYTSIKQNEVKTVTAVNAATGDIETLQAQVFTISNTLTAVQLQIVTINNQIITINGQLVSLTNSLNSHIAAQSAHGATGDIVGTDDYCTLSLGGTVLLAAAVANATPVSTTPPAVIAAAGATYSQAYTQSQTDTINALRQNVIDLVSANNSLVSTINQMLDSERTAKQRGL